MKCRCNAAWGEFHQTSCDLHVCWAPRCSRRKMWHRVLRLLAS